MTANPLRELDALNPELVEGPNSVTLFTRRPQGARFCCIHQSNAALVRQTMGPLLGNGRLEHRVEAEEFLAACLCWPVTRGIAGATI